MSTYVHNQLGLSNDPWACVRVRCFGAFFARETIAEFWYCIYLGLIYICERSFALAFVLFLSMIHTGGTMGYTLVLLVGGSVSAVLARFIE